MEPTAEFAAVAGGVVLAAIPADTITATVLVLNCSLNLRSLPPAPPPPPILEPPPPPPAPPPEIIKRLNDPPIVIEKLPELVNTCRLKLPCVDTVPPEAAGYWGGTQLTGCSPTLAQTFEFVVASLQTKVCPVVLLSHKAPKVGLVFVAGLDDETYPSDNPLMLEAPAVVTYPAPLVSWLLFVM
jgi:hypothetical protein